MDVFIDVSKPEQEFKAMTPEREIALQNLSEIEDLIEGKLKTFAEKVGGGYIPPTAEQITQKFDAAIAADSYTFYHVDENGTVWDPGAERGMPADSVKVFNETGLHGYILMNQKEGQETEAHKTTRLYRGCIFRPDQPQVASMARMKGIEVVDLSAYREGRLTLDELVMKAEDEFDKRYLQNSMEQIREKMNKYGTEEFEEIKRLHTAFTSGATDIDLWVSSAQDPIKIYRQSTSVGNAYGDFIRSAGGMDCVLIIDAPTRDVEHFGNARSESGIFGEVKPEWIKAIIPATGNQEQFLKTLKEAETKILEQEMHQ